MTETVFLYRAITGPFHFINKDSFEGYFDGVTDDQLMAEGIACSNRSFAQYQSRLRKVDAFGVMRRVDGLPVYLNFSEAETFLDGKRYKNSPAIVKADIPLDLLDGNNPPVRIIRNFPVEHWDFSVSRRSIESHLNGERRLEGEYYVRGGEGW